MKEPTFKINPRFRLTTNHLSVVWHCVDKFTVECEAAIPALLLSIIAEYISLLSD